jgi:hypothetical protein
VRNPFRRNDDRPVGRSSLLDSRSRGSGSYTVEIPEVGTGHYIYDASDSCAIHSRRLEAWCDVADFDTARDELHWHCMVLSQLGVGAEEIRAMGHELIEGRREKLVAEREIRFEAGMAKVEGKEKSAGVRTQAEGEERKQAEERERQLREEADAEGGKLDALRERFDALPRRERVPVRWSLVVTVSISFTIFDVGVFGNALDRLPGDWYWKWILVAGVALAPLSTAIGIAQWLSAAEVSIREGVKATRLALVAGLLCIIGIGCIVLFRAAATGEPPIPWHAYVFLAFLQSALGLAETMLYTVYFDSKIGDALLARIKAAEARIVDIDHQADSEHQRAVAAQARVGEIERDAQEAGSELSRANTRLGEIRRSGDGDAAVLRAIVESAILEGVVAAERSAERKRREADVPLEPAPAYANWLVGGMGAVILYLILAGSPF